MQGKCLCLFWYGNDQNNHIKTPFMKASIALADHHVHYRHGLASLLTALDYTVLFEACNGQLFLDKLINHPEPQIALIDINMRVMDGYETTLYLKRHYPSIKVLALSMYDDENAVIRMFSHGAKGFILKDCEPAQLEDALHALLQGGFYYAEPVSGNEVRRT